MTQRDPQYLLSNPVEIGSALNELLRGADRLCTSRAGEILPVYITQVDVRRRLVNFLPYGGERERKLLATANGLAFEGSAYGTPIEFDLKSLTETLEYSHEGDERLVIQAPFPVELYRIQRRQFFRAPVAPPNTRQAIWTPPQGDTLVFRIQDVSLAGIGLRIPSDAQQVPQPDQMMQTVELDFEEHGSIQAWLQIVTRHTVTEFDNRRGHVELFHLGCVFAEPDLQRDGFLQRLVHLLERVNRR